MYAGGEYKPLGGEHNPSAQDPPSSQTARLYSLFAMLAITLIFYLLLSTTVFSLPTSKERLAQRIARRASGLTHFTNPNQAIPPPGAEAKSNSTRVKFSSNWSGAVLVAGSVRNLLGDKCIKHSQFVPNT